MELFKQYGFWIGIVLVFTGLILRWITGLWSVYPLIPLVLGGLLVIAGTIVNWSDLLEILGRRTTKYGLSSLAGVAVVIIILVFANLILNRFNFREDTTAGGQFSLADQTVKVLKSLENEIEVIGFQVESSRRFLEDRLREYANYSGNFTWRVVDPDKNPEVAERYNIQNLGTLVVSTGLKTERVDEYSEQNLTNAIIKVTREETKSIYFLTGHDEHSISDDGSNGYKKARESIQEQNYEASELFLAGEDSIPGDASLVVIPGAQTEYLDKELNMLAAYIGSGGNVFFLVDPTPAYGFSDFLKKYYFDIGNNIVVDVSGLGQLFGTGPAVPLVNTYGNHPITEGFGVMTFFPLVRSVDVDLPDDANNYTGKVVAKTSQNSWGEININRINSSGQVKQDPEDIKGPVPIAATMEVPRLEGDKGGRLIVFGDSDFATNQYFGSQGNGNLFMNAVNWALQDEDLISVRPKSPEDRRLRMTQSQVKTVLILVIILLPVLLLAGGGVIYWVRRG